MKNIKGKLIITLIGVIINLSLLSNISNAQNSGPGQAPANASGFRTPNSSYMNNLGGSELGLGEGSNSLGRGIGSRIDFTSFTTLKRIRGLINEGQNEDAANKTITYISQMEGVRKDGMETPFYAAAYNELCLSSTNLRKVEYAMGVCNKSLELTPDHWESLKSRATLYFMTQDFPKALDDFNNSLENAPKNIAVTNVLKQNIGIVEGKIAEK